MKQFDRKLKLKLIDTDTNSALELDKLHIDFIVEKTNQANANLAKVLIYNLSENSRGFISKQLQVTIYAGYQDENQAIFVGRIITDGIIHEFDKGTWATIIDIQDGDEGLNKVKIDKSFEGKVKLSNAIKYLIQEMGLGNGILRIPDVSFNNGLALSGFARDRIKELCKKERLVFNVEDGNVNIYSKTETLDNLEILVNADTGLINSPIKKEKGIEFETLLNPEAKIGKVVNLDSRTYKGKFKITELLHYGTNYTDAFYSKITGEAV